MADNTLNTGLKDGEVDNEEFLTWNEIVALNKEAEKNAEALLGGQDDMVCSYPEGYKYRQPLYSCRTCAAQTGERAGVCYACSLNCHDGHDLVELYTKRKFCCDCGNSKFKEKCKLFEEKDELNLLNKYGHNFDKLYCTCNKPYPPEDDEETQDEDMHQCVVCEDWYHLPHIFDEVGKERKMLENLLASDMGDACDMICKGCAIQMPFLMCYKSFAIPMTMNIGASDDLGTSLPQSTAQQQAEVEKASSSGCKIENFKLLEEYPEPHTIYFEGTAWRDELCKCAACLKLYADAKCEFLLETEDTMCYYDEKRRENMALKGETSLKIDEDVNMANKVYDIVAKKTNNRDAALQAYMAVDEMTKYMADFFKNADSNKVITKEDIQQCFDGLRAKRPRLDLDASSDGAWTA